jgi:hypothetical protein
MSVTIGRPAVDYIRVESVLALAVTRIRWVACYGVVHFRIISRSSLGAA